MSQKVRPDFLVVGLERSGTHWVAALLNNHPKIACFPSLPFCGEEGGNKVGEVHFFNTIVSLKQTNESKFIRPFEDFSYKIDKYFADLVPLKDEISLAKLYEKLIQRYSDYCNLQRGEKEIVGESTPAYVLHLDFIDRFYPGIKKICSIRDPKDKIVSWHYQGIRKGRKKNGDSLTEDFALDYLNRRIIPEYEALLSYHGQIHCLTYEGLHKDVKAAAKKMVDYLGYSVSEEKLTHMVKEADFSKQTARDSGRKARERGEQDIMSGFRKGVIGDWKENMSQALAYKIDKAVNDLRKKVFSKYHIDL